MYDDTKLQSDNFKTSVSYDRSSVLNYARKMKKSHPIVKWRNSGSQWLLIINLSI